MSKRSKKGKNKKKRKQRVADAARRRAEQHKGDYESTVVNLPEGVEMFRVKSEKAIRIDIIPFIVGKGNPWADKGQIHYERTFWTHRGIGADENSYVCLKKTLDKKCPICDFRRKLMKDPDADDELIKDLAPKERQLFNIIDTKDRDKGIQIWELSFHLFGKKLDAEIRNSDEDDNYEDFADLEKGSTLKCTFAEKTWGGNPYFDCESIHFKTRKHDYDEDEMLAEAPCLDDVLAVLPYDELKTILLQTEEDEDEDEDESKSKKKKKDKKKKSSKKKKDEDEDDEDEDEDEDDEDEDEDEDEEDEDEDENDDDDEDDEDEDEDEDWDDDWGKDEDEDEDDEDEDENDDDDDEDDEDEKPKSKKKSKSKSKSKKKSSEKSKKKDKKKSSGKSKSKKKGKGKSKKSKK